MPLNTGTSQQNDLPHGEPSTGPGLLVGLDIGVTKTGAAFLDPILSELAHLRTQSQLAQALLVDSKVSLLPADYNPGTWGAVVLAYQSQAENDH